MGSPIRARIVLVPRGCNQDRFGPGLSRAFHAPAPTRPSLPLCSPEPGHSCRREISILPSCSASNARSEERGKDIGQLKKLRLLSLAAATVTAALEPPAPVAPGYAACLLPSGRETRASAARRAAEGAIAISSPRGPSEVFLTQQARLSKSGKEDKMATELEKARKQPAAILKSSQQAPPKPSLQQQEQVEAEVTELLKTPTTDAPIVQLVSNSLVPRDGEVTLKDPADKKAESAFKRAHENSMHATRAAAAASMAARASLLWIDGLLNDPPADNIRFRQQLVKIQKAQAFMADATLDSVRYSARVAAASVLGRRHLWLKNWAVDNTSRANLTAVPYDATKLFGEEALKDILVESVDKRRTMPTTTRKAERQPFKKNYQQFQNFQPFRPSRPFRGRFRDFRQQRGTWGRQRFPYRGAGGYRQQGSQPKQKPQQ
ncbi:uncharacterized protein LOC128334833 [Hemicordylus capensis]|uniref:uncharacterized protein LOC128334833 n=1 Tax=Hemicordylus capensis TaxID=884348 RepID=UPI002303CC75|nr:uncharacterized protein LOC128334833 [Hemicordylus capensis]